MLALLAVTLLLGCQGDDTKRFCHNAFTKGDSASCQRRDMEFGKNIIDSQHLYTHDPIFCNVPHIICPTLRYFVFDYTGLRIPVHLDCNNLNKGKAWSPTHDYYNAVPDRWYMCNIHEANLRSSLEFFTPSLPLVDEEYDEQVTLVKEVVRVSEELGQDDFVLFEAGARWGTWGFRAVALANLITAGHMKVRPVFWEPDAHSVQGIHATARANNISDSAYRVYQTFFDEAGFVKAAADFERIDYLDIDIQKGESVLCEKKAFLQVAAAKVRLLKIGTHTPGIHENLLECLPKLLPKFKVLDNVEPGYKKFSMKDLFRNRRAWKEIRGGHYFHNSSQGPFASWDGDLALLNTGLDPSRIISKPPIRNLT